MIKFEHAEVVGWEAAVRGMRNPMNSWEKSDSEFKYENVRDNTGEFIIGPNDLDLMKRLRNAGTDHRKFMRMIVVYVDITAPLYWWKEFDTYRVGVEKNSCSTMHKITDKEFTLDDFSCEHLFESEDGWVTDSSGHKWCCAPTLLETTVNTLNAYRDEYLGYDKALKSKGVYGINPEIKRDAIKQKQKDIWWQLIQLLPSSYNQKRTVMMSYEVLANIYKSRKNHKLDEWRESSGPIEDLRYGMSFCDWIKTLPYSALITEDPRKEFITKRFNMPYKEGE